MLSDIYNTKYAISDQLNIKRRIDKKVVVFHKNDVPDILDTDSAQLLLSYNEGKTLADIIPGINLQTKYHKLLEKLVDKKYLVKSVNVIGRQLAPAWTLDEVFFELGKNCNLSCRHCYIPKHIEQQEIKLEKWIEIADQCKELGVGLIKLTGGEPMLAPFFWEILSHINKIGIRTCVYTNGSFLNNETIAKLSEMGVARIQISLDGGTAATHDSFRQTKGNFSKILSALPNLDKSAMDVGLSFTVSEYNYAEIQQFLDIVYQYENIKVIISPYINYHQTFSGNKILQVSDEILNGLKDYFQKNILRWSDKTRYYLTFSNKYIGYCGFGVYMLYIDSTGRIYMCPLLNQEEHVVGNVMYTPLSEIWKESKLLKDYRKRTIADIEDCNSCRHAGICRGGCRARAYFEKGNFLCADTVSCKMH